MTRGISRIRKTGVGFIAALIAVAGLIPLATGAGAAANLTVDRIQGADRFGTGAAVAQRFGASPTVIVARADLFPDALASSYVAGLNDAAIMLVRSDGIPAETSSALTAAGATRAIIMGGNTAVNPSVEAALVSRGITTRRIGGPTRWDTAQLAAQDGGTGPISTIGGLRTAIVARGDLFPDALSGGPIAYNGQFPIILTDPGSLIAQARAALQNLGIRRVEILGGTSAVSAAAQAEIASLNGGITVERLEGPVRTATSVAIAEFALGTLGFTNRRVGLANGLNFPDALTYGSLAGKDRPTVAPTGTVQESPANLRANPVLVSASPDALSADARNYMANHSATLTQLEILGGPLAISAATAADAEAAARTGQGGTTTVPTTSTTTSTTAPTTTTTTTGGSPTTTTSTPISDAGTGVSAGPQLRTGAPDLLSVSLINGIPNDATQNAARFIFDEPVIGIVNTDPDGAGPNATRFSLQGFDSATRLANTGVANIDPGNANAVVVQFPEAVDLRPFTIGTVDAGAVTDGTNPSVLASKAMGGSTFSSAAGATAAPDLIAAVRDDGTQQVTYTFDQPVQNAFATQFGYYDAAATPSLGNSIVSLSGTQNSVTVQFSGGVVQPANPGFVTGATPPPGADTPVSSALRFFANDATLANALADSDSAVEGTTNPTDNPLGHLGAGTSAPDLTSATKVANQPTQIDFNFDVPVNAATAVGIRFAAYQDDGTRFDGSAPAQNGSNTIRATFIGINQNNVNQIVLAGVNNDAVDAAAAPNQPATVSAVPLTSTGAGTGFTDGPDLINATYNTAASQVTFTFDENVADVAPNGPPTGAEFFIVNAGGTLLGTGGATTTSGANVTVTFGGGLVSAAAGAGVESPTGNQIIGAPNGFAANDFQGNANSPDSVGGGPAPG